MRPDKSVAVPNIIERAPVRQNEKGAVNEGICTGHRRSTRPEPRVSPGALHGKTLPARLNGVKAQGRDRGGSPQGGPVLSRGGGDRGGCARRRLDGGPNP